MKVLFIAPSYPVPANSGGTIATLETLRSINSLCDLHLLVPPPDSERKSRVTELRQLLPDISLHFYEPRDAQPSRIEMYKTAVKSALMGQSYWASLWMNPRLRSAVERLAAEHRYDVVHCDWLHTAVSLRGLDLPLLIRTMDVHFVGMREWADSLPAGDKLRKSYWQTQAERFRRFEAATLSSAPVVVTLSAEDDAVLKAESVVQTMMIPPPREVEMERMSSESHEPPLALFMGRLDMAVNREAFFFFADKIWPHLREASRSRVKTVFAGGFPDDAVRSRAAECNIEIRAPLSDNEARDLFAKAAFFLSPVVSGTGIKIKTLDAMANSKAIIGFATAFRGVPVEHGVHAMIANSPEEFARAIETLSLDPAHCRTIGLAAREFVRLNYDPATLGARLINAYSQATEIYHQARLRRSA